MYNPLNSSRNFVNVLVVPSTGFVLLSVTSA